VETGIAQDPWDTVDPWQSSYPINAIDANIADRLRSHLIYMVIPDMNAKLIVPNRRTPTETMRADVLPPLTFSVSITCQTEDGSMCAPYQPVHVPQLLMVLCLLVKFKNIMVLSLLCLSLRRQVAYGFSSKLLPLRGLARKRGSSGMAKFVTKL